jgi:PAS domain S-box-containing protein
MPQDDERLKSIVEASPIGVIILDDDGIQLWVNRHACEMLGARPEQIIGKHPTIFTPEPGALGEMERLYRENGRARNHEVLLHRIDDGKDIWVSCQIEPLTFGGGPARICWLTDISNYKLAQSEREAARTRAEVAEAQLRAIAEALPVGVIVFDRDRRLLFWNERYCALTATTSDAYRRAETFEDVVAYVFGLFPHLSDWKWTDFLAFWEDQLWGEDTRPMVLEFEKPKMSSLQFVSRLPDGGSILAVVDITEQKNAETEALRAQQEAEDANRAKSTFLAAMSHEIRTPMNGVLGMIEVLEQSTLTDEQRTMTQTIRESASALLTIIDDVLDFSKIEAGHLELEAVPLALRPLLESTLDSVAGAAEAKSLDLTLDIDQGTPEAVIGDPVRLRQIVLNLLSNALKFTATGGVSLSVTAKATVERVSGTMITISITDSGIGISDGVQQTLFTPFTQAESSTTRRFGGTGLGLSICQRLVDLMGGSLGVESQVGAGATFWFSVPMEVSAVQAEGSEFDLEGLSILVVSPRERLSSMAATILEEAGARVSRRDSLEDTDARRDGIDAMVVDDRVGATAGLDRPAVILSAAGGARRASGDVSHVTVNRPPRREALRRAVAVVAGRASPDVTNLAEPGDLAGMLDTSMPDIDAARAAGTLVLVAEDNATNRLVVERQLALLGHACEIAEDGVEALALWRRGRHVLLLTDCHMPNLDGYDLVRTIRREEDPKTRLPIVALTANALSGEADRCFEAGMDDYMAKPVTLAELRRVIGRWMAPVSEPPDAAQPGGPDPSGRRENGPIDRALLRDILGGDDPELFDLVAGSFRETAKPVFEDLRRAIAKRQASILKLAAHKAAGAAGSLAAVPLRDALRRIEETAGEPDWAVIDNLGGEVEGRLEDLLSHLESDRFSRNRGAMKTKT